MIKSTIQSLADDIYNEGDIDLLFFGFMTGYVSHDSNDNTFGKSDGQIFEDTLKLIEYLVMCGDFVAGCMCETDDDVQFTPYVNGFVEFESVARQCMYNCGLHCDALCWELVIRKVYIGKASPPMPEVIGKLFCSTNQILESCKNQQ